MTGNEGAYRDPLQGLRARVEELALEVQEREARITETLTRCLPAALADSLVEGRARAHAPAKTAEELTSSEAALTAYRDALDQAIDLAPEIESFQRSLPAEAPELEPLRNLRPSLAFYGKEQLAEECASLKRAFGNVRVLSADAVVERLSEYDWRARLHAHGAPFTILAQLVWPV